MTVSVTRRDWWLGILTVAMALLAHAAVPRYEVRLQGGVVIRVDRWTGHLGMKLPDAAANAGWISVR